MRIVQLTPGTGTFHCGSCLRDLTLVRELLAMGHDVTLVPLYLPLVHDQAEDGIEEDGPLLLGGINLYLEQKAGVFGWLPKFVRGWLNAPWLLRKAADRMGMTSAEELGKLTVESFKGVAGKQKGAWRELLDWLKTQPKPDVISLSNGMLGGVAPALREELQVPVVTTLQGEDTFLDRLPEPYRTESWKAFSRVVESLNRVIGVSDYYGGVMQERLGFPDEKLTRVWNGIEVDDFPFRPGKPDKPTIGYLARLCEDKGVDAMIDGFIELKKRPGREDVRLRMAGALTPDDEKLVERLKQKLEKVGVAEAVDWQTNVTFEEKLELLGSLTVFSVPSTYGESFGLYVVEALACGVPVVQPRHAGFIEIVEATKGGILFEPKDVSAHADALEAALDGDLDFDAAAVRKSVEDNFSSKGMARGFAQALESVAG
ncbi:MAG: glycosyltransferase family 4 protein [Verrucomicrobiota bacterium]